VFSGSRFIFWALTPLLLLCAGALAYFVDFSSPLRVVAVVLIDLFILLLILGLYDPRRNEWALRFVTGTVFIGYLAYWVDEVREGKLFPSLDRGVESVIAATAGLLLIGWPCLKFTLMGFRAWDEQEDDDHLQ
jgi:hypothetical protein